VKNQASTVKEYLAALPEDRRRAISALRDVIRKNLPEGYAEGMQYGMIGYFVPHSVYPAGYHCDPKQPLPFASIASQKNHMALYMMCVYSDPELQAWFKDKWTESGKKLDMGKSCVRFKKIEDVPLDVVGAVIRKVPVKKFLAFYESAVKPPAGKGKRPAAEKTEARGKATAKKAPSRKKIAKKK